ncbi:ras, putative [Entamoeba invadens IP1]|uniref:Ras, putative n=1 Tax=Entamoeba invadens IP1 TaxID=370355 RepID=A0A0A1UCT1_ENTIV|nr:ras, putative [Entamoeba invadens IP1]ELP91478.1 ras, putative [Entamoeba invadens IP1]|eukprot:XP_004258249.1 ras, putative [Entamoeba invadens IP1]
MIETKILLLGDGGVGKTSIAIRFICDRFIEVYDPTNDDPYTKRVTVDDETYSLELIDVAGSEEYAVYRNDKICISDGFLVVYSITDSSSFDNIKYFIETIYRILDKELCEDIPIVLYGNKCDLELNRDITTEEGKTLAEKLNVLFFEGSAKNNINIEEVIYDLLREIYKQKTEIKNKTKSQNDIHLNTKNKPCIMC